MILWTIQPIAVYQKLINDGIYRCNPILSENCRDFLKAYDWLEEKMISAIGPKSAGVEHPVWAWYCWNGNRKKPDMRRVEFREANNVVVMEIEIPDEKVFLSDYDCWHAVHNDAYYHYEESDEEWDAEDERYELLSFAEQERVKLQSWDRDVIVLPSDCIEGKYIQATFWELQKSQLKKVYTYGRKECHEEMEKIP